MRRNIEICMSRCGRTRDGWIRLTDLGNELAKSGVRYNGKLTDVCKDLGFKLTSTPGGEGANPNSVIVYVK